MVVGLNDRCEVDWCHYFEKLEMSCGIGCGNAF